MCIWVCMHMGVCAYGCVCIWVCVHMGVSTMVVGCMHKYVNCVYVYVCIQFATVSAT